MLMERHYYAICIKGVSPFTCEEYNRSKLINGQTQPSFPLKFSPNMVGIMPKIIVLLD
jgi:hypothetical protein